LKELFEKIILVEIILHIFVILAKITVNSMYLFKFVNVILW